MKIETKTFDVYPNSTVPLKATAVINDGKLTKVCLHGKIPKGYYYSYLNDAYMEYERQFLNIN